MHLKLTNTLSNKLEIFTPINNKNIKMYVCGPTVYDDPHIGNARALVVYDVLFRVLRYMYGDDSVTYVRNITDIDDKIIERANSLNVSSKDLTEKITKSFHEDCDYLGCLSPTHEPKATDTLNEIINIISILIDNGSAYEISGNVYFRVNKCDRYGELAGRKLEDLISTSKGIYEQDKENQSDFALWKAVKQEDGDNWYPSPWGKGRPGWHIECSAMSHKFLGTDFDIHGGGADLMFPHHTNEIAQSCNAFPGSKFARYWVHNGFLTVRGEKMSKSLGNFLTIKDMRRKNIKGEALRLLLINTHYRSPIDYNEKAVYDAETTLNYFYRSLNFEFRKETNDLPEDFVAAILDDLNIHKSITKLTDLAKEINKSSGQEKQKLASKLYSACRILGFLTREPKNWFGMNRKDAEEIEELIKKRKEAKDIKNWAEADHIRKLLADKNVILEDNHDGTTNWRSLDVATTGE